MALRIEDVDLAAGRIRVERSYDPKARVFKATKNRETRTVPVAAALRSYLAAHKLRLSWSEGLLFGRTADLTFADSNAWRRAHTAWKRAGLEPIGLHECRHTYASLMIAAGVNARALSTYMGHSSIQITLDRYGHLMPGNEDEAAGLLDAYLERARQKWASEGQR
jgi:integrase